MTILIALLTLTVVTFFLIGNLYSMMQHRVHSQRKTVEKLQKKLQAQKNKFESQQITLKNNIKEAERKIAGLKKASG